GLDRKSGRGSGPRRIRAVSGSYGHFSALASTCLASPLASRPASIRTLSSPLARVLDGVPRFGGALLSQRRSRWTKTQNAVCPIATVMLSLRCQSVPPFPSLFTRSIPNRLTWLAFPVLLPKSLRRHCRHHLAVP